MPYPNEHACRVKDPDQFERFMRKHVKDTNDVGDYKATGKAYDLIIGFKSDGSSAVQAHRYPKDTWTAAEARKHCKAHEGISFEPARDEDTLTPAPLPKGEGKEGDMEVRYFPVELRTVMADEEKPVIEGSAAVYGKKSEVLFGFREVIEPGFFENVLKQDVRALWNHNADLVLGRTKAKTLELEDNERALGVRIHPPDTQVGRDAVTSIERGDVDQMSFGFTVKQGGDEWKKEGDGSVTRILKRGGCERLFDVSPVTFPAYPQTSVSVRSMVEQLNAEGLESEAAEEERMVQVRQAHRRRRLQILDIDIQRGK